MTTTFPTDNIDEEIASVTRTAAESTEVKSSLVFDFDKRAFVVVDGNPATNADVEATKQWVTLFFKTDRDKVPVYKNTKFGTSIKKLIGYKSLNNGYFESEIERETREGLPLCPTIKQVVSFNMTKKGKILYLKIIVELQNGSTLDLEIKVTI